MEVKNHVLDVESGIPSAPSPAIAPTPVYLLFIYVLVWYGASVVCNTSAKKILFLYAPLPLYVSLFQFLTTVLVLRVYLKFTSTSTLHVVKSPIFYQLVLVYTLGFVFVNSGYLAVSVSLAETLRSAEPIFAVLFAKYFLDGEDSISLATQLTLIPIVFGGVLSSGGDSSFSLYGLVFVTFSNIMFALRSILTKQLKFSGSAIVLFYEISLHGFLLLLWLILASEMYFYLFSVEYSFWYAWNHLPRSSWGEVLALLIQNGLSYCFYNQMSFIVLSLVSVVTHAVANSFRRVVTIVVSVWMFSTPVSGQNLLGIILAISGVVLYSLSKSRDDEAQKRRAKV